MPIATASFDIPPNDLVDVIKTIGQQAHLNILYVQAVLAGHRSARVKGRMSAVEAVRAALTSSHVLECVSMADGTLVVRPGRPPPAASPRPKNIHNPVPRSPSVVPNSPTAAEGAHIIVTALRRPSPLLAYPGSLTVLSGDLLDLRGETRLPDAAALAPGLTFTETGSGQRRITLRGLHSAGENSVLLYLDETPVSGPTSATSDVSQMSPDIRLVDVDRIEVLRGPQGTLFGSGAMGGAVRILYRQPDPAHFSAGADLSGELMQDRMAPGAASAMVNLPLDGGLAVRASAYEDHRPGYVNNIRLGISGVNREHTAGGRVAVRLEPADGLDITATLLKQHQYVADSSMWYAALGPYRTDEQERLPFPNDFRLASLVGHASLGPVKTTAVLSHYRWNVTRTIDATRPAASTIAAGTYCPLFADVVTCNPSQDAAYRAAASALLPLASIQPMTVTGTTRELRLATPAGSPITLTTGLFLEHRSDHGSSGTYRVDAGTGKPILPMAQTYLRTMSAATHQSAVFADVGWRLASGLVLDIGGRRYAYAKHESWQVLQTSILNGAIAGRPQAASTKARGWTQRVNLSYRLAPGTLVYAQVASGFRPGGINSVPNLPTSLTTFASDQVTSYEIGFRSGWLADRLLLNAAAYRLDWSNIQTAAQLPNFTFVSNSGTARNYGLDLEGEFVASRRLRFRGGLSLLDARLVRAQLNPVVSDVGAKGDHIPFEPSATLFLSADYSRPIGTRTQLSIGADLNYTGHSHSEFSLDDPDDERMGGFAILGVHGRISRDSWSCQLTLSNAFNAVGSEKVETLTGAPGRTLASQPRTIELQLSWNLGHQSSAEK